MYKAFYTKYVQMTVPQRLPPARPEPYKNMINIKLQEYIIISKQTCINILPAKICKINLIKCWR